MALGEGELKGGEENKQTNKNNMKKFNEMEHCL